MSVEFGGGSTGDRRMAEALRDAGRHVFAYLYETYAARLFDYCEGILDDELAATIAVQDSLVTVDSKTGKLPDGDQLRLQLYSTARRQCMSMLSRGRVKAAETDAPDAFAAGQADRARGEGASAAVAAAVLSGLSERDREVLNLAFRHSIEGADLATVLGVSSRRARAMLSEATARFRQAAGERSDQVVEPAMLAEVPLAKPPLTLRLRLTRTALALGSSRSGRAGAGAADDGVMPVRYRSLSGRRLPHAVVVSSLGLVILAVPGAMLYKLATASGPGPVAARMVSGLQGSAPAISPPSLTGFEPPGSVHQHTKPPLPGLGPAPLGVLPTPTPSRRGSPPTSAPPPTSQPPPTTRPPTTPPPTTPPTTPPPTTPPPTTPPPTTPPPTTPPPTTPPPTTPPPTTPPPTTPPTAAGTPTPTA